MKDETMEKQKLSCKNCGITAFQQMLGGKWKTSILWVVHEHPLRFSEIRQRLEGVTESMLTKQLRELERDGFLNRKIYPVVPPRVEYSITELGKKVLPVLSAINKWSEEHILKRKNQNRQDKLKIL